ncbi:MAG: ATP-binding protein, partial [Actinomycetota bacterium]
MSLLLGILFGIAVACRTQMWRRGVMFGLALTTTVAIVFYLAFSMPSYMASSIAGIAILIIFSNVLFTFPPMLTRRFISSWDIFMAGVLGTSGVWIIGAIYSDEVSPSTILLPALTSGLIGIVLGLKIDRWQPVLLYLIQEGVWNRLIYFADKRRDSSRQTLLHWHSAFWDEFQRLPLFSLRKHLILLATRNMAELRSAMEYLNTSHQSWAVWIAQIELYAPILESCTDLEAIRNFHHTISQAELESPAMALLRTFTRLSQDVNTALQQTSAYNQRLALKRIADILNNWVWVLNRYNYDDEVHFAQFATNWHQIITNHIQKLVQEVEFRQEIDNPYIIGVPLTEQQEIFTGRTDFGTRIEQLILDRRRPPLLLYGQRRMGKTSLLNNLGRLLPNSIIPLFVDLQGPVSSASDYAGFLYNIARAMIDSAKRQSAVTLPPLTRETLAVDPFTSFDEWLDRVEQTLDQNIALLSFDEFEALDDAISKGRFDEQDVLGMLRHLIQHRPRFKLLLSCYAAILYNGQTTKVSERELQMPARNHLSQEQRERLIKV